MKYSKELSVGVSLVVAAVIFVVGIRYLEDIPLFRSTYNLSTSFESVNGLNKGNDVRVNGVRVGAVESVELDPAAGNVHVEFHLDRDVRVPEGSYATVAGIAALASIHLNVHLGPADNPVVSDGGVIPGREEGDMLGMLTERGPELTDRVEQVLANANDALQSADVMFEGADVMVERTEGNLRPTLLALREATETLARTIRAEQQSIHRTVSNLETFSEDMAVFSGSSSDTLSDAASKLNRSMTQLDQSLATLDRSLVTLDRSTTTLDEILAKVNTGDGTLGRLINDPGLYVKMDSTITTLNAMLEDMQENPGKYLKHMSLVDLF